MSIMYLTNEEEYYMLYTGKIVKYYDNEAIILTWLDNEVLLFIEDNYVKWVDKSMLEITQ